MKYISLYFIISVLSGCVATRDPMPMPQTKDTDMAMTCQEIEIEYKTNTEIAAAKIEKNNKDDTNDFLLGCLVWPGLADFKNADGTEANEMLDRNIRLRNLSEAKGCDISKYPPQPKRYE